MERWSTAVHRRWTLSVALLLGFGGLVAAAAAVGSLRWPLVHDAALMHYVAWLIRDGAVPYRDVFDMNLPGTYLVHLLVVSLPGDLDLNWRLFDLALLGSTLGLMTALIGPRRRWSVTGACAAFALLYLSLGPAFSGERDMLTVPLQLLGVLAMARSLETRSLETSGSPARTAAPRSRLLWALAAGVAFGAAGTIKPFVAATFAAVLLFAAFWLRKRGRSANAIAAVSAAAVAGAALPVAGVLLWLGAVGALPAFFDAVLGYLLPIYSGVLGDEASAVAICHKWLLFRHPYSLIFLFATVFAVHNLVTGRLSARYGLIVAGFLGGIAQFALQQKGWPYHLLPMAAFGTLLCFWDLEAVRRRRGSFRLIVQTAAAAWLLVPMTLNVGKDLAAGRRAEDAHRRVLGAAEYLRPRLDRGQTVQVFDTSVGGADVLLRTGTRQPTRFLYDFHLLAHDPRLPYIRALREECLEDLRQQPPAFIVYYRKGWPRGGYERMEKFPELSRWIRHNYVLRVEHDDYRILENRNHS